MDINKENLSNILMDELLETISTMTGIYLSQETPYEEEKEDEIAGAMILAGSKPALLVISTRKASAATLLAYMTGIDLSDQSDNDQYDVMAEIVNMVAGKIKAVFVESEYSFILSSPFTIFGANIQLVTKSSIEKYIQIARIDEIYLKLGLYYV